MGFGSRHRIQGVRFQVMGFGSGYRVQREDDTVLPVVAAPLRFCDLSTTNSKNSKTYVDSVKGLLRSSALRIGRLSRIVSSSVYASLTSGRVCKANSSNHATHMHVNMCRESQGIDVTRRQPSQSASSHALKPPTQAPKTLHPNRSPHPLPYPARAR